MTRLGADMIAGTRERSAHRIMAGQVLKNFDNLVLGPTDRGVGPVLALRGPIPTHVRVSG